MNSSKSHVDDRDVPRRGTHSVAFSLTYEGRYVGSDDTPVSLNMPPVVVIEVRETERERERERERGRERERDEREMGSHFLGPFILGN